VKLAPESLVADKVVPSPNHGERRGGQAPDLLLLHYTGMAGAAEALARLTNPLSDVSAHYFVYEDGRAVQLVPESRRAWHAGAGAWAGETDINSRSIGIEIVNPGHEGGLPPYPDAQIEGVIRLCADLAQRWSIRPHRVLAHSDIAPTRKEDPGELFPWDRLHRDGVGHWVEPAPLDQEATFRALRAGDEGTPVRALQTMLTAYGYEIGTTGIVDALTESVVRAFQRHFRPARVDGVADLSTITTLRNLLLALPG
jgi:N-acetylmuramoyl-L-alanine amidase